MLSNLLRHEKILLIKMLLIFSCKFSKKKFHHDDEGEVDGMRPDNLVIEDNNDYINMELALCPMEEEESKIYVKGQGGRSRCEP